MEIEVPAQHPQVFSNIKRKHRHVLQLETVLMTVYYPSEHDIADLQKFPSKASRELWLGRPRLGIADGYGRFAGVGPLALPIFLPTMFTKLPAWRNAPIAAHWAPSVNVEARATKLNAETGPKPQGAHNEPIFPLVLFSHGLGGTRTMYSSLCGEFASYGFVVCAVEHRDGSGPRTYINHAKSGLGSEEDLEKRGGVDHTPDEKEKGYDVVDYLFPLYNRFDTAPKNEKGVDHELRNAQIALRLSELEEAYRVICEIAADGNGHLVEERNLRREGFKAASSSGLEGVDWARWKGRVNLQHITAAGHSFGAATVTEILRDDKRFDFVSQGIIYDIWGAGTRPPEKEAPNHRIHRPLLAINSEAFTYWRSNYELVESLVHETQDNPCSCPAWLLTVRGTVHVSQSDFSLLYPHISSLFLKMTANPKRALDLNINASLEFLSHVLPADLAQVNRAWPNEKLLDSNASPLDRIPSTQLHRPRDDLVAVRLRIRHEWLYRISPKLFRRVRRKQNERRGKPPETGDEIWLHIKPSADTTVRHTEATEQTSSEYQQHGTASKDAPEHADTAPDSVTTPPKAETG